MQHLWRHRKPSTQVSAPLSYRSSQTPAGPAGKCLENNPKGPPCCHAIPGGSEKCEPPDLAAGDAKILLRSINFEFLLCLEITTPVFLETSMASNALQQKDLKAAYTVVDGVLRRVQELRTDEQFTEIFMKATTAAEAEDIEIPEQIPGQGRRRKVPEKFKYSSTSANEDHHVLTLEEYYRGKLYFTFLDLLRQELERRFRGEGKKQQ
ncbi:Zinc finger MYM-type protein 1 [Dissostichus eleginoides]|uniref:Zinc finger MYM-type protein 1 n=1 Tax=Dissostichus eleginoides TaxID=100907 RepID=A0AAD9B372_DISEL|nr:Zinc finger MYM-type protein 1 [Dissostichus eleginoides]